MILVFRIISVSKFYFHFYFIYQEFEYWYPFDLRVSAKDLIPNHLTMSLYNHVEIWKDRPQMWPKGIYCNGHIMVDAEKMVSTYVRKICDLKYGVRCC